MNALNRFDTQALNRALIGFDTMFDQLERRFANQVQNNYPPHNVIRYTENTYAIEIAVAGFSKEEITVEVDQDQLIVRGVQKAVDADGKEYLHRGLASRDFEQAYTLAEYMEIRDAEVKDGMLIINIERVVPEALKPRQITIK